MQNRLHLQAVFLCGLIILKKGMHTTLDKQGGWVYTKNTPKGYTNTTRCM